MSRTRIGLSPVAGFCVKSSTVQPAVYSPPTVAHQNPAFLEPPTAPIPIPAAQKVFINIAWDKNVPPPPEALESVIQSAIHGQTSDWYVPVVVSEPRFEPDKAGRPSIVFDCVYNSTIKPRILRDPDFKTFLIELAIQRIEDQTSLVLSRQISTPNIASKGKLAPRTVSVPTALIQNKAGEEPLGFDVEDKSKESKADNKPLIQEISASAPSKGILKKGKVTVPVTGERIVWNWAKRDDGRLEVKFDLPGLTHDLVRDTQLDIEIRRIMLHIPGYPHFDMDLGLPDAQIAAIVGSATTDTDEITKTLMLKRQRDFDVEGAEAEWRVGEEKLLLIT